MKMLFPLLAALLFSAFTQAFVTLDKCEIKKVSEVNHELNDSLEFYKYCEDSSANQAVVGFGVKNCYKNHFYRKVLVQFQDKTILQSGVAVVDDQRGQLMGMGLGKYLLIHSNLDEMDVLKIYYESIAPTFDCINDNACFKKSLKSNFFKYFFDKNYFLFKEDVLKAMNEGTLAGYISHISLENSKDLFITFESNTGKSWQLEFFMDSKQRFILGEIKVLFK